MKHNIQKITFLLLASIALAGCGSSTSSAKNPIDKNPSYGNSKHLKIISINTQDITSDTATIIWSLSDNGTGQVEYGKTESYGKLSTNGSTSSSVSHSQTLSNLEIDTTYHYRILSEDKLGNKIIGIDRTFKTKTYGYLKLPSCDTSNPKVKLIKNLSDWSDINNEDKNIFCVSPGDYSALGLINLNTSGTKTHPRYIILDNGNNNHPVNLERSQTAKYRLSFNDANYWIVDRQVYWETDKSYEYIVRLEDSEYNVFNRGYITDTVRGYTLYKGSHNNTIQNAHMERTQWTIDKKSFSDRPAIALSLNSDGESAKNNKILNNEVINYVDALQLVRPWELITSKKSEVINFEGTLIKDNNFYITKLFRSDGHGNQDPNGNFMFAETGIDLKGGSLNPDNPVVIENNFVSGYYHSDPTAPELGDPGSTLNLLYRTPNVMIKNNIFNDATLGSNGGAGIGGSISENLLIENNIYHNIRLFSISVIGTEKGIFDGPKNTNIKGNLFVNVADHSIVSKNSDGISIENNRFINSGYIYSSTNNNYKNKNILTKNNYSYHPVQGTHLASYVMQSGNTSQEESIDPKSIKNPIITLKKHTNSPEIFNLFK